MTKVAQARLMVVPLGHYWILPRKEKLSRTQRTTTRMTWDIRHDSPEIPTITLGAANTPWAEISSLGNIFLHLSINNRRFVSFLGVRQSYSQQRWYKKGTNGHPFLLLTFFNTFKIMSSKIKLYPITWLPWRDSKIAFNSLLVTLVAFSQLKMETKNFKSRFSLALMQWSTL